MNASRLQLPPGPWATLLDGLCARFPAIGRATWIDRFARGRVQDADGVALPMDSGYRVGAEIRYFRELAEEPPIAAEVTLLHCDAHLVVVDKPHFLPVMPAGAFVNETALTRLRQQLDNPSLVPLHRLDRETAGVVLFSANPASRAHYHGLFQQRAICKHYEAIAPALPDLAMPYRHRSRIVRGEPFFRMREVPGEPNSETCIEVIERHDAFWHYRLQPLTGRKHQLRLHMSALGAAICNDRFYPQPQTQQPDDPARPLQLLARSLQFVDPIDGRLRSFTSRLQLRLQEQASECTSPTDV